MSVTTRLLPAILATALAVPAIAQDAPTADTVVATVNGTDITLGHMLTLRAGLGQQYAQLPPEVLFGGILDQLIDQQLLAETEEALSQGGQLVIENESRAILANQAIRIIVDSAVTDEAISAAYDEAVADFEPVTEFNASHILLETEDDAKTVLEELEAGADFAELAMEKSTGPSGPSGGSLDWFGPGAMIPAFEAVVSEMEPGAISEPLQTQYGWHVILLNDTRLAEAPPLEAIRPELVEQIQRDAYAAGLAALTENAEVDRSVGDQLDPTILNDPSLLPD